MSFILYIIAITLLDKLASLLQFRFINDLSIGQTMFGIQLIIQRAKDSNNEIFVLICLKEKIVNNDDGLLVNGSVIYNIKTHN